MRGAKAKAAVGIASSGLFLMIAAMATVADMVVVMVLAAAVGVLMAGNCFHCGREYEMERTWNTREPDGYSSTGCPKCGNDGFYWVADRKVCTCCGEVRERE